MEKLSLTALARHHLETARQESSGRSAHTVYGGHEHILRQTVMAFTAGRRLDEHENPGEATVHVLHGRVRLSAGDVGWEGFPGDLLIVPAARHTSTRWKTPPCCSPWPNTADTALNSLLTAQSQCSRPDSQRPID